MTNDEDYQDYFETEKAGTGPLHEVSPRKSKESVTQKSGKALADN